MSIFSTDYEGRECVLVHEDTGKHVEINETIRSFRGDPYRVTGGRAPHKASSHGKVWFSISAEDNIGGEFYPFVLGLRWVPV